MCTAYLVRANRREITAAQFIYSTAPLPVFTGVGNSNFQFVCYRSDREVMRKNRFPRNSKYSPKNPPFFCIYYLSIRNY